MTPYFRWCGVYRSANLRESKFRPALVERRETTWKHRGGLPLHGDQRVVLSIGGLNSNHRKLPVGKVLQTRRERPFAAESIMTAYACGGRLASTIAVGDSRNPRASLGGASVNVRDAAGVERLARLYFVSLQQVNYVAPSGTARGIARVTATSSEGAVFTAWVHMEPVAPVVFTTGSNHPAALVVRLRNGVQTVEPADRPIDMGPATNELYLVLFGTGLRFRSSLANVGLNIGKIFPPVEYVGPQSQFAGLDQINARPPRSLAGRGIVFVNLWVDGEYANPTTLEFQ